MNEHVESLNQIKSTVIDLAIKFGPKVFVAIVIIFRYVSLASMLAAASFPIAASFLGYYFYINRQEKS